MMSELSTVDMFVRGRGRFVDDINLLNMLHMAVVRSPFARAKILSIKGGINGKELKGTLESVGEGATEGAARTIEPVLPVDMVNYLGQPVAAVFGSTLYEAQDEMSGVEVEYEPLKPVVTIDNALSSPPIHPYTNSNIISDRWRGKPFEISAPVELEDEFYNKRVATNPIETRGIVASYDGRLTVWISTQSAHAIKEGLCSALNLSPGDVRVIQTDTGGAFGLKGGLYSEYVIASYAAMKFKRPVKWIETRREHLMASRPGRGAKGKVKLYADRDGKILGLKGEVIVDGGAYSGGMAEFSSNFIAMQMTGPYAIEKAHVRAVSVFTNKVPIGPYRGAGRPEAAFFIERMMDRLADELHMDPVELRIKNAADDRFKSPLGVEFEDSRSFIQRAASELNYSSRKGEKPGFACFVLVPATQPGESCRIVVRDGRVKVWTGGNSHGQGHDVFVRKLISQELQVPESIIDVERGDTDMLEEGVGAWGSRSAMVLGDAVVSVARKIRDQAEKELGRYTPELLLSNRYDVYNFQKHERPLNSLGANMVFAEVDEMGMVNVREVDAYYDVGVPLNRDMVEGQIIGGSIQGIGQVLSEEIAYDSQGQLLTASISDAGLRTATTAPRFVIKLADSRSSLPHGAKGLGESPTIGVPAALVRAIELVTGRRIRETPVRPEYLLGL
jgi:carbon-monoxide dehydrogenase large subunit